MAETQARLETEDLQRNLREVQELLARQKPFAELRTKACGPVNLPR